MTIEIELTKGKTTIIDDVDGDLMKYRWQAHQAQSKVWYAQRGEGYTNGLGEKKVKISSMHREILSRILGRAPCHAEYTDHINGNGLDNRRINIRVATPRQSTENRRKLNPHVLLGETSSKFKGVSWHKNIKKWQVAIKYNYKKYHLGYFLNETDAAKAYDRASINYFGEFAKTNFDKEDYK